jgi:pimeloyl-ACP methyl ester carboxylesterase
MPVITALEDDLPLPAELARAAGGLAPGAPVVVMIHGFRYDPRQPEHDPRRSIYHHAPGTDASWTRHLRLLGPDALGVGFAWRARGTIWRADWATRRAGQRLAELLRRLAAAAPGRSVHLFAHSLGARVALLAMADAPGTVARAILLAPAASRAEARAAHAASGGTEVVSVTSDSNLLYDALLLAALPHRGPTLAGGIGEALPGWLDLSLDDPQGLARIGARVRPARRGICHWSGYLRPGVWPLYRALLAAEPRPLPLAPARPRPMLARVRGALLPGLHSRGAAHARRAPDRRRPDHGALLAHAQRPQGHDRAGGDGPPLPGPTRRHRQGRAVSP